MLAVPRQKSAWHLSGNSYNCCLTFRWNTRVVDLELRTPFRLSRGASTTRRNVILEMERDGIVGRGEAAPIPRYRESAESAREAIESSAARITEPSAFAVEARRLAVSGQRAAQAAVDEALHDLAGRRLGVPVCELLGLARRPLPPTSWTIGLDPIPEAVAKAADAADFEVLKIKLGAPGDVELVRAVRETTGRPIRVDANEGWTVEGAEERLPELERLGVEFIEQPLPADRIAETAALRRRTSLPFVADESVHTAADIPALAGAFDGINVKLVKCGGIAPALHLIATARAHGMKILLGCMIESSLGIAAALAIAPLVDWIDLDGHLLITNDPFRGIGFANGRLIPPHEPGLGVEPR